MKKSVAVLLMLASATALADDGYNYQEIAKRHAAQALSPTKMAQLKMEADCLVGIKKLNYKRKDHFDPIAEWTSFRTRSLLEQYTPCETLVMLELASKQLKQIN